MTSISILASDLPHLLDTPELTRVDRKSRKAPSLHRGLGEAWSPGAPLDEHQGEGVLIGIIDTGFDLTHPALQGRVRAYLDQVSGQIWIPDSGTDPFPDRDGHGTHVASIAGGSAWGHFVGIAPKADLLLVKTDFINTDLALNWILDTADDLDRPVVVNMSFGHHFGAHDGTDSEERFHAAALGPGKVAVVSAGNSGDSAGHASVEFRTGEHAKLPFEVLPPASPKSVPGIVVTMWHYAQDEITLQLRTPWGEILDFPDVGRGVDVTVPGAISMLRLSRQVEPLNGLVNSIIDITFAKWQPALLRGWRLELQAGEIRFGRVDAWIASQGAGCFSGDSIDRQMSLCIPGTGEQVVTVGSYVSANEWTSDLGDEVDNDVVVGRASPFTSEGPTRDGRHKPDLVAPGQHVTAALAEGSDLQGISHLVHAPTHAVTLAGTSMAAPVVAGAVALLLAGHPHLGPTELLEVLTLSATSDEITGKQWSSRYGSGRLSIRQALDALG